MPTVRGHILAQGQLTKKQRLLYFVLKPCQGEFLKFEKQEHYDKTCKEAQNGVEMSKLYKKYNAEIILLQNVMSLYPSFRGQFINKAQHCLELCCYNE